MTYTVIDPADFREAGYWETDNREFIATAERTRTETNREAWQVTIQHRDTGAALTQYLYDTNADVKDYVVNRFNRLQERLRDGLSPSEAVDLEKSGCDETVV